MSTAKIFTTGRSQAVRLPKEFRFDGDEVCIKRIGPLVVLFDPRDRAEMLTRSLGQASDDFLRPIGPLDMLIAAHALSPYAVLVTNNDREFKRVRGLNTETWSPL